MHALTRVMFLLVGVLGLMSAGCQDMYLADDIDIEFDFNPLDGAADTLHSPYVLGTEVTIWAHDAVKDIDEEENWRLESSDESILRIDSRGTRSIHCTAVGEGTAEISVYNEAGERVYSGDVEVRAPNGAELYAHGPLLLGRSDDEARVDSGDTIQILAGGMASFLVRYFDDNQRLYGNGVLVAESVGSDQIELFEETTHLFEEREWLQLRPNSANTFTVDLYALDVPVGHYEIQGVTHSEVDRIELIGESERGADDEETLVVLAQAFDNNDNPIYGVEYAWDVSGEEQTSLGDLYRYHYDDDYDVDLTAQFQGHEDGIRIHSSGGYVSSTNNLGCSVTAVEPSLPSVPVAFALLGLTLTIVSRRRRSR